MYKDGVCLFTISKVQGWKVIPEIPWIVLTWTYAHIRKGFGTCLVA